MPKTNSQMFFKGTDQVIFFLISITTFIWISVEITGFYLYR